MKPEKMNCARLPTVTTKREVSGRRVFVVEQVKSCAPVIDADEQQEYNLALRIAEANAAARRCAPVITAKEWFA